MSKKVVRICDICKKECEHNYHAGPLWSPMGVAKMLNYIGWRIGLNVIKGETARLKEYERNSWVELEICNECQMEMFKWVIAKKLGTDQ